MDGRERTLHILRREQTDRVGLYEHFWDDTYKAWLSEGHYREGQAFEDLFRFDMQEHWAFNLTADLDFVPQVLAQTEDTVTILDGNGATLRRHRKHDTTPEHIAYRVSDRESWDDLARPLLKADPRRIDFEGYRRKKQAARAAGRAFFLGGVNVFESIHPLCGHVNMLLGMADDPGWVQDMAEVYADLIISLQKTLFEREGLPDGVWYYEDMGFKGSPFMSPAMYSDIIQPAHARTIAFAHGLGLPVILHSCGYVEPLLPGLVEAGIDCLQVIEVKAGMDLLKLNRLYGRRIAFMGGIDVRALYSNDRRVIDRELESKLPAMMETANYVVHSDHSIPKTVRFDTYRYFIDRAMELGRY